MAGYVEATHGQTERATLTMTYLIIATEKCSALDSEFLIWHSPSGKAADHSGHIVSCRGSDNICRTEKLILISKH